MVRAAFALCFFLGSASAAAFELAPEYQHLNEREIGALEGPERIDAEYRSDILTYSLPFSWRGAWLRSPHGFQVSLGSLDGKRFLAEQRLKARKDLGGPLAFEAQYLEQSDFENEFRHLVLAFDYELMPRWSLSLYGEPSSRKSEDDAGAALTYAFSPRHRLRLFHTWIDFSLNQRNEAADFYTEKPRAFGFVGRNTEAVGDSFVEYALRIEPESRRTFPSERLYAHENRYFHFLARRPFAQAHWNLGLSHEDKRESGTPFDESAASARVRSERKTFLLQREEARWIHGWQYAERAWSTADGRVRHRDVLPHVWYELSAGPRSQWSLGYEFTWHRAEGPEELRASLDHDDRLEHRLNLAYRWRFPSGALKFLFTADLDEFGGGKTWEGGSGQLQIFF